jgi:hypothetical protein
VARAPAIAGFAAINSFEAARRSGLTVAGTMAQLHRGIRRRDQRGKRD